MQYLFTTEYPQSKLDEIVGYLLGPRLWVPSTDYPDFYDWAQKAHEELRRDLKRALVGFSHGEIAGVIIYQRHKQNASLLEMKNLTVRPDHQGRYIASFLLRNAEVEGAREFRSRAVVCDAKASNAGIHSFLLRHHYRPSGCDDIYRLGGGRDVLYRKAIEPSLEF